MSPIETGDSPDTVCAKTEDDQKSVVSIPSSVRSWFHECVELTTAASLERPNVFKAHYQQWCKSKQINTEVGYHDKFLPLLVALGLKTGQGQRVKGGRPNVWQCLWL
jgi:hypothetical protein